MRAGVGDQHAKTRQVGREVAIAAGQQTCAKRGRAISNSGLAVARGAAADKRCWERP
jgi:uncharacterized Zn-binding protein involved in type VI secretion